MPEDHSHKSDCDCHKKHDDCHKKHDDCHKKACGFGFIHPPRCDKDGPKVIKVSHA